MSTTPSSPMFTEPPRERSFPTTAVAIAAVAVVVLVVVLVLMGRRDGRATLDASYAPQLVLSDISMSESDTPGTGGKVTYIEGHVQNNGAATVTGVTVQTTFPDDVQMPPQVETTPLRLIRIREPEMDTQPVSAAPIAPGKGADFQLIFENVNNNWNTKQPAIAVVGVEKQ